MSQNTEIQHRPRGGVTQIPLKEGVRYARLSVYARRKWGRSFLNLTQRQKLLVVLYLSKVGVPMKEICDRFAISKTTAYRYVKDAEFFLRYQAKFCEEYKKLAEFIEFSPIYI